MQKSFFLNSCGVSIVCALGLLTGDGAAAQQQEEESQFLIEEVIVTAQRREQSLFDVPVSISSYSQNEMDARTIVSIEDIARVTPGLNLTRGGTNAAGADFSISIRGVRSEAGAGTTGIYINDTPIQAREIGFNANDVFPLVFDLERVEVLRGPQGTLFGAGSEGGTIRFITPEPSLTDYSVYGRSSLSFTKNGDPSYQLGLAGGGPLIEEKLGFRASAWYQRAGGYVDRVTPSTQSSGFDLIDNNANWQDNYVARGALKWSPIPELEITPSLYFQRIFINDTSFFWLNFSDTSEGVFRNGDPTTQNVEDRFILPAIDVSYQMDFATFVATASYFDRKQEVDDDFTTFDQVLFTGIPFPFLPGQRATSFDTNEQENYTIEARFESNEPLFDRLSWVAGVFYSENNQIAIQRVEDLFLDEAIFQTFGIRLIDFFGVPLVEGRFIFDNFEDAKDKQLAGFIQGDFEVIDGLTLTAGVRVSDTEFSLSNNVGGPVLGPFVQDEVNQSETPVTPKFGISYQPTDDHLIYASASKGFRIGGANAAVGFPCGITDGAPIPGTALGDLGLTDRPLTFDSDSLWNYEIGAKNSFFGGRLRTDVSVYHIDWSNIQQFVLLGACGFRFFDNLGSADINGFELSATAALLDGLTLSAAIGYSDAEFNETVFATPLAPAPIVTAGDKIPGPPLTVNLVADYRFTGFWDKEYFIRVDWDYQGDQDNFVPATNPNNGAIDPRNRTEPSTHFVVLRAGVEIDNFDISAFAENLFNSDPELNFQPDPNNSPLIRARTFRPRTIGVRAIYRF